MPAGDFRTHEFNACAAPFEVKYCVTSNSRNRAPSGTGKGNIKPGDRPDALYPRRTGSQADLTEVRTGEMIRDQ